MATAACGINCDVCKLNLLGSCSSCGPGKSRAAEIKLAAQQRLLGGTCSILACANMNQIDYCMRDCSQFPCDNFSTGPYPFSQGYLDMQKRRLQERPPAYAPDGSRVKVAPAYWDDLRQKDIAAMCNLTLFTPVSPGQVVFQFLNEDVMVDIENCSLKRKADDNWIISDDPLLELVSVLYLINVDDIYPIGKDIVGVKDLKEGHFFQGPHALRTDPLLNRYGSDLKGFRQAAEYLGGESKDMADAAYKLSPYPRINLYFLLWQGDEEFPPQANVLLDRPIERVLAADAIWALINRVTTALLEGPRI
ncbi:hypothetical protein D1BOALGB6SA_3863 [Olavius sp. associated proteobacterium Delta 1]|nr:hypothetical protein D1BOALGB6SA_3863 [Olavius sp. associated proteobacterium Delta 1]